MAAIIPTELLVLLVIALLIRTFNRGFPFWRRLLTGLSFWPRPADYDIALFIKRATNNAHEFARTGSLERNAGELAGMLVDSRAALVPAHSGIIADAFGWASVELDSAADLIVMTGVYAGISTLLCGSLELFLGKHNSFVDIMLVSSLIAVIGAPLRTLFFVGAINRFHIDVVASGSIFALAFLASLIFLHLPSRIVAAVVGAPLVESLGDLTLGGSPLASGRSFALPPSGGAAAGGGDAMAPPSAMSLAPYTIALSLAAAALAASLYLPLLRAVRLRADATLAYCAPPSLAAAASQPLARAVAAALAFAAPVLMWAALAAPALDAALRVVPPGAAPCCGAEQDCLSLLRDCTRGADGALQAIAPALLLPQPGAPWGRLVLPESLWLAARLALVLGLAGLQLLLVRAALQLHLAGGWRDQVDFLVRSAALAVTVPQPPSGAAAGAAAAAGGGARGPTTLCSDGREYPAGSVFDAGFAAGVIADVPLPQRAIALTGGNCEIAAQLTVSRVAIVTTETVASPLIFGLLAILFLRHTAWLAPSLAAAAAAARPLAPALARLLEAAAASRAAAAAVALSAAAEAEAPLFLLLPLPFRHPAYAQLCLLYLAHFAAAAAALLLALLSAWIALLAPATALAATARKAAARGAKPPAAAPAPAPAAAAPAATASPAAAAVLAPIDESRKNK